MGDELTSLLVILKKVEECGGQATLSVTTKSGMTKTKLVIVSSPSTATETTSSSAAAPSGGQRRRRRRGPAARAKVNARAAQHQATLAGQTTPPAAGGPTSTSLGAHLPPQRALRIHPSPAPDSGQRQIISLGRGKLPAHSFLNLDGSTLPPSSPLRSATATTAAATASFSTTNTTAIPWAPPMPINSTVNALQQADPQVAARVPGCLLVAFVVLEPASQLSATIGQHPEYCNGWIPKSFCDLKVIMVAVLVNKAKQACSFVIQNFLWETTDQ